METINRLISLPSFFFTRAKACRDTWRRVCDLSEPTKSHSILPVSLIET